MSTALVTGASSGIGRDIALILAKKGYDLVLVARNKEALRQVAKKIKTKVTIISADLSKRENLYRIYEQTKGLDIEILVNDAGFGVFGDFAFAKLSELENMIDVNITAFHTLMHLFLHDMIKKDRGRILNVSSLAAYSSGPMMAAYYASKGYIYRLSTAVAYELKAMGSHVTISVLCPGPVNTDFNRRAGVKFSMKPLSSRYTAACGVKGMFRQKLVIIPGIVNKLAAAASRFAPLGLQMAVCHYIQHKKYMQK